MSARGGWLYRREESWWRRLVLVPLSLASWLYGIGARLHRAVYARGLRRRTRLSCRVLCVGNLTVGGAGKTPTTAWLAGELHRRGHKVVIASRGYGRRGREPVLVVSDGRFVHAGADRAGDEPILLAGRAPGVPVLVGRDRGMVGLRAIAAFGADLLILDDGFQHHRLARDLDVVVFDGALGLGNRRLLPRGPLREPLSALARADVIGVIDGPLPAEDEALLAERAPNAIRFSARREPLGVRPLRGGQGSPPEGLAGREVGLLAGIARPGSLERTLTNLGARVVARRVVPDHHRYRPTDLAGLEREAPLWITTEKDAVKILPAWVEGADVRVLAIDLRVADPVGLLERIEARLR